MTRGLLLQARECQEFLVNLKLEEVKDFLSSFQSIETAWPSQNPDFGPWASRPVRQETSVKSPNFWYFIMEVPENKHNDIKETIQRFREIGTLD